MTAPALWNEATNQALTAALGNHLWQSTSITVVVWLLSLSLRKNYSGTRYRLWMVASVKFLVPFPFLSMLVSGSALQLRLRCTGLRSHPHWSSLLGHFRRLMDLRYRQRAPA